MPVGAFVPSRIHLDYPEWQAPLIGNVGQVWAYDGAGYVPTSFLPASAVSVYGLTLASAADAAAARTALALGTAAVLNVGTGASNVVQLDGSARLPAVDGSQLTGISGGSVAGSNTQVIFNDSGVYAGDAGLTYAKATDRLTVVGGIIAGDWSPPSDSTTAVAIWNAARTQSSMAIDTVNRRMRVQQFGAGNADVSVMTDSRTVAMFGGNGVTILQNRPYIAFNAYIGGSPADWRYTTSWYAFVQGVDGSGNWGFHNAASGTAGNGVGLSERFRIAQNGNIGIGVYPPTALLDLAASTTTRASLRVRAGTAPTTPNAGDIWYPTGGRLNVYRAATETIASGVPGTGGAATATGTWGATEQSMLQKCYDIVRAFGMLS